jgi:hypothetical protein
VRNSQVRNNQVQRLAGGASAMNRRKFEDQRHSPAEDAAKPTDRLALEEAGRVIAAWNDRQARHLPMLFAPTIGAALVTRHHFLWVHCRGCRTVRDVDLRMLDCNRDVAVTGLSSELLCSACGSKATFPQELLRLSKTSVVEDVRRANARRTPE